MLSYKDSLKILKETNALLEGHFILSSGLHSKQYVQCAKLLSHPQKAEIICSSLCKKINKNFNKLYYKKGSCKNAEKICKHIVNFPTHLRIDNKNFEKILIDNKKFIKNNILKNV